MLAASGSGDRRVHGRGPEKTNVVNHQQYRLLKKLLFANRGKIAVRMIRAAAEMGIGTICSHLENDAQSMHIHTADEAHALKGTGVATYPNMAQIIAISVNRNCDASW